MWSFDVKKILIECFINPKIELDCVLFRRTNIVYIYFYPTFIPNFTHVFSLYLCVFFVKSLEYLSRTIPKQTKSLLISVSFFRQLRKLVTFWDLSFLNESSPNLSLIFVLRISSTLPFLPVFENFITLGRVCP